MIASAYCTSLVFYYYRITPVRVALSQSYRCACLLAYAKQRDKHQTHKTKSLMTLAALFTHRLIGLDRRPSIQIPIARQQVPRGFVLEVL